MTTLLVLSLALADPPAGWTVADAPDQSFQVFMPAKTVRTGTRSRTYRSGRLSFRVQLTYTVTADGLTLTAEALNLGGSAVRGLKAGELHQLVADGDTQDGWQVGPPQPSGTTTTYTATKGGETKRVQMTGGKGRLYLLSAAGAADAVAGPTADTFFASLTPTPERAAALAAKEKDKKDKENKEKDAPAEAEPTAPKPKPTAPGDGPTFTTDPAQMAAPDTPVAGFLVGGPFTADAVTLRGGILHLTQGAGRTLEAEAYLFLHLGGESPAGKSFRIDGSKQPSGSPHIHLKRWPGERKPPAVDLMTGDYGLRLEFGPVRNGKVAGKLYLCRPDRGKGETRIAGKFEVEWAGR